MRNLEDFDILIIPGWQGSGADHWQTHWQEAFPAMRRVEQDDWELPVFADWSRRLDEVLGGCDRPVVLVAHSLGTALVSRWAHEGRHVGRVAGAFLVAPTDVDRFAGTPDFPARGFDPVVMEPLPFPAMILASTNDERVTLERATVLASAWGARLLNVGALGHMGTAAKLGLWPRGLVALGQFIASLG